MPANIEICPEPRFLTDYLLGKLPTSENEFYESHLSQCSACVDTVRNLAVSDTLNDLAQIAWPNLEQPTLPKNEVELQPVFNGKTYQEYLEIAEHERNIEILNPAIQGMIALVPDGGRPQMIETVLKIFQSNIPLQSQDSRDLYLQVQLLFWRQLDVDEIGTIYVKLLTKGTDEANSILCVPLRENSGISSNASFVEAVNGRSEEILNAISNQLENESDRNLVFENLLRELIGTIDSDPKSNQRLFDVITKQFFNTTDIAWKYKLAEILVKKAPSTEGLALELVQPLYSYRPSSRRNNFPILLLLRELPPEYVYVSLGKLIEFVYENLPPQTGGFSEAQLILDIFLQADRSEQIKHLDRLKELLKKQDEILKEVGGTPQIGDAEGIMQKLSDTIKSLESSSAEPADVEPKTKESTD